jgi:hypothetical protein
MEGNVRVFLYLLLKQCDCTVASVGLWIGVPVSQHLIRNVAESK